MVRTLRAFAWMRWRIFVNSLERTGARDRLERFSIAIEQLGPVMAAILTVPTAVALAGLGAAGGYMLAPGGGRPMLLELARYLLLAATGLSIVGPLLLPAGDRTNPVRLLLLPISRPTLYAAQVAAAVSDVWVLLAVPLVLSLPFGLAAGGQFVPALRSLAAGVVFVAILAGITALATTLLHLLVRDRRRGELVALVFILLLPLIGMLPGLVDARRRTHASHNEAPSGWASQAARRVFAASPSELYLKASGVPLDDGWRTGTLPLLALAGTGLVLHAGGLLLFGKVLDSPGTTRPRRSRAPRATARLMLPWLSPGASAVAFAQLRLAMRTPRGRSTLLSPLLLFLVFGLVMRGVGGNEFGFPARDGGLGVATFGSFVGLLATLPIVMNQFAVDGAGLTLALLSPLSDGEVLRGKATGNALIAFIPIALCLATALVVFRSGSPALWISIPLALVATYAIVAPLAAILSAIFPRAVDMNSIGRGSNAHGLASLLGVAAFAAAAAPNLALVAVASTFLQRPSVTPVLLAIWCVLSLFISKLLFVPAERIFRRRRENLALIV